MVKRIFSLPLRTLQGFSDSVLRLANVPLVCPHYTCISRRAKEVEVCFKTSTRGIIQHLAIDATGLKVHCEGEWTVKKHGTDGKVESGVNSTLLLISILIKLSQLN